MRKIIALTAGVPVAALAGIYVIMAVWDRLIRSEIIPNATFEWFPTVAVLWGCACIAAGVYLFRSKSRPVMQGHKAGSRRERPSKGRKS